MAVPRRFKVGHEDVFPFGAFMIGEVSQVMDFEKSTKEVKVPQIDPDTGARVWSVDVVDADPEARKKSKTVSVKVFAAVQPVPPEALPGLPFRPVVFEGLEVTPYLEETMQGEKKITRMAWSFRATGLASPKQAAQPAPVRVAS